MGVLVVLWVVRFVLGLFVQLAQLALVAGLVVVGAYAVFRLWRGWSEVGTAVELPRWR